MFAIGCPKCDIFLFFAELRNNFCKLRKTMKREKMKQIYDEVTLNSVEVARNFPMSAFSKATGYYKAISYHSLCDIK